MKTLSKNTKWILLGLLFVLALIIQEVIISKQSENFPLIKKSDEIIGRVSNIKIVKGGCYITLNKTKIGIASSQNYEYESEYIHSNISIGDSIIKKSGSDTIKIIRDDNEYLFVHGKVLNKHLK